jgi:hypothetical protein
MGAINSSKVCSNSPRTDDIFTIYRSPAGRSDSGRSFLRPVACASYLFPLISSLTIPASHIRLTSQPRNTTGWPKAPFPSLA